MMRLKLDIQLFAASATITNARQGNYSIDNNNEVQRLTFTVVRTSGTTYWQDNKTLTFTLKYYNNDGTQTTLTQSVQFNFPSGSVGATKSTYVDFTVPHKTDGTQNITYEASIVTGTGAGTLHPTGSDTLATIPRASSITVNDANIGSATNIVINKTSANFTTTLYYKASGQSEWTKIVDKTSNQVYGWTVPASFYSLIPNSKTIQCQFYAETYNEDTLIGTSSTVTATFTATGNPIINSITKTDINATTTALTGDSSKMVKYASNVRITVSTTAQNSASISSIVVNGITASSGIVTINNSSTNSYQIVVTDSRGYTTTQTEIMTMIDYVPLTLNATIVRNQPTDGIVNINYNGNYFNDSFGSQNNSLTVEYRYVEKGQDINQATWHPLNPTTSGNNYLQSNYQISGYDYQKQYEFQIQAIDEIQTRVIEGINVPKGKPIFWWDDDGLYVEGDLKKGGTSVSTGIINDTTITIQKNSTTIDSFTTNASSPKTIDIPIPTKTSDLTNDSIGIDFITVLNDAAQTIKGNNTNVKYNLNTVKESNGNKLTFNSTNHEVVIGSGVSYIEVSALIYLFTRGANSAVQAYIYKNNTQVARSGIAALGDYVSITIPPIIVSVQQNDKISVYIRSSAGTNTNVEFGGNTDGIEYLTVKVIK